MTPLLANIYDPDKCDYCDNKATIRVAGAKYCDKCILVSIEEDRQATHSETK